MNVQHQVIALIAEHARLVPSEIEVAKTLGALGIDSLALVETIFALEETFDISIPFNANDSEALSMDHSTVAALIETVETLLAKRAA